MLTVKEIVTTVSMDKHQKCVKQTLKIYSEKFSILIVEYKDSTKTEPEEEEGIACAQEPKTLGVIIPRSLVSSLSNSLLTSVAPLMACATS